MNLELRPLQIKTLDMLRDAFRDGHQRVMLYGPTGFGKTELAISLMDATAKKSNRAAMIMDRIILCSQTSERLQKYKIDHGVLQSGHWRHRPSERIQICSAQTLEAMGAFPMSDLIIIDEAHIQRASIKKFIHNSKCKVIGLSASPFTKGLGETYTKIISATTTKELVDEGWLAPLRVFISKEIDMTGAKKVAGEWSQKEATARGIKITGDIVSEWVKKTHEIYGEPKKTIVFCAGVAHGEDLSRQFAEAGYNFVSISYKDEDEFKSDALAEFAKPDSSIHGLIATDVLTKGFDQADVMIGISARPFTKSFSSHVQQLGRVMRPHADKSAAIWLDHSGNFLRFRDQWEELYGSGVDALDDDTEKAKKEPTDIEKAKAKCPVCGALWPGNLDVCTFCGHVRQRRNDVMTVAGKLLELTPTKTEKYDSETKERWFHELLGYARANGKKDGWAWYKYQDKFNIQPPWKKLTAPLSDDVRGWIQHSNIKNAKRRAA